MSKKEILAYRQCTLSRSDGDAKVTTVCWLDAAKAKAGTLAQIDTGPDGAWQWWSVDSVGESVDAKYVEARRDDHRSWRDFTDI